MVVNIRNTIFPLYPSFYFIGGERCGPFLMEPGEAVYYKGPIFQKRQKVKNRHGDFDWKKKTKTKRRKRLIYYIYVFRAIFCEFKIYFALPPSPPPLKMSLHI
jgi:hypothetical protein